MPSNSTDSTGGSVQRRCHHNGVLIRRASPSICRKRPGNTPRALSAAQREAAGCQRCGSSSSSLPAGCVGKRVSTSFEALEARRGSGGPTALAIAGLGVMRCLGPDGTTWSVAGWIRFPRTPHHQWIPSQLPPPACREPIKQLRASRANPPARLREAPRLYLEWPAEADTPAPPKRRDECPAQRLGRRPSTAWRAARHAQAG